MRPTDLLCPPPKEVRLFGRNGVAAPVVVEHDATLPGEGYRLTVTPDGVRLAVADAAGERHGRLTLGQLGTPPPAVEIVDWPDLPVRGVMLDVSRDKVPTLATLEALITRLAALKINHVQLYLEHTFAYSGHETVWAESGAYTAAEIARLQAFCDRLGVDLVPQQNCLGHMERWLAHDRYAHLAALPGGYSDDCGNHEPAACLDPALEDSFALIASLLPQLAAAFRSRLIHVGLDEPIDLNPTVWKAIFAEPTDDDVWQAFSVPLPPDRLAQYLRWVQRLRALPALADRELLMWADVVAAHPETAATIPAGVTLVEWGYEAEHPFDLRCRALAAAGRRFWVCPGTSSWSSLAGRPTVMTGNVLAAADAAAAHGGDGLVCADWGNEGHFQYLPVSEPGFAFAAAAAWNRAGAHAIDRTRLAGMLDAHVFRDRTGTVGSVLLALGDAYLTLPVQVPEASVLAALLQDDGTLAARIGAPALEAVDRRIGELRAALAHARLDRADGALVLDELDTTGAWLQAAARRGRSLPIARASLLAAHRRLWLARNRPQGLVDSLDRLEIALN